MAKVKGHPIVLVEWIDSCIPAGPWHDADDEPERYQAGECRSVGWLLDKDENRIVIYGDTGGGQRGRFISIPIGCVKSIKTLVRA